MGKPKWTREEIIRRILDLDAKGYPMTVGKPGVSPALYQAGSRIFGSWRNALLAAGLSPDRGNCDERWPPAKILMVIRNLSRRETKETATEFQRRVAELNKKTTAGFQAQMRQKETLDVARFSLAARGSKVAQRIGLRMAFRPAA
ncbi:MAG: hypothetical protein J0H57_07795 [Rhodospirillales bacterium]|nr:hypothetical protein [Rhodospirillales bacterium]